MVRVSTLQHPEDQVPDANGMAVVRVMLYDARLASTRDHASQ
jgi:hypothetical protein